MIGTHRPPTDPNFLPDTLRLYRRVRTNSLSSDPRVIALR